MYTTRTTPPRIPAPVIAHCKFRSVLRAFVRALTPRPPSRGSIPLYGLYGFCSPKGYGFPAVLVINRVLILADFGQFVPKYGMVSAL